MMGLPFYQVDSFTDEVFTGNPAAVVPLDDWLPDDILKSIALENNLPETAFFIPNDDGFHLRWFTPTIEIDLCGHATLATAWVLFNELGYNQDTVKFKSLSGDLTVTKNNNGMTLNFPLWPSKKYDLDSRIEQSFSKQCLELHKSEKIWVAIYDDLEFIKNVSPNLSIIKGLSKEGVIITAAGTKPYDFVSRYFAPQIGIDEDPVTGSAHCLLAPIWAEKLGKTEFLARQISPRGGDLKLLLKDNRLDITGNATLYLKGTIYV